MRERRRSPRTTLIQPIEATVDSMPAFVLDVSTGGLRVVHRSELPPPGGHCKVNLPSDHGLIDLDVVIVHTAMKHATAAADQLFSTGLRIKSSSPESSKRLEAMLSVRGEKKR